MTVLVSCFILFVVLLTFPSGCVYVITLRIDGNNGHAVGHLFGVVVHRGDRATFGHYNCYVKRCDNVWMEANDNLVIETVIDNVLVDDEAFLVSAHLV